jgi:hypothetical protein
MDIHTNTNLGYSPGRIAGYAQSGVPVRRCLGGNHCLDPTLFLKSYYIENIVFMLIKHNQNVNKDTQNGIIIIIITTTIIITIIITFFPHSALLIPVHDLERTDS